MGSYSGTSEIVEAREELSSAKYSRGTYQSHSGSMNGNDQKSPVLKLGYKDSLGDDINKLFEVISLKHSSKGLGLSSQVGASTSTGTSPLRKNAMKRPITVGMPHSPGIGNSEQLSLKQALRELCISKASEMAAMRRLSKSTGSPGVSESGRIRNLYNSVVLETSRSGLPISERKETMVEISLVPEESTSSCFEKVSQPLQVLTIKSSDQSAKSSPGLQTLKSPNISASSSPRFAVPTTKNGAGTTLMQNDIVSSSRNIGTRAVKSPKFDVQKSQNDVGFRILQSEIGSSSTKVGSQALKLPSQSAHSSPQFAALTTQNGIKTTLTQNEIACSNVRTLELKQETVQKEKHSPATSPSHGDFVKNKLEPDANVPNSKKISTKASAAGSVRKGRLHASPSSINGNKVGKLTKNTPRLAKSIVRNKSSVKKKIKQGTTSVSCTFIDGKSSLVTSTGPVLCQKCQCSLKNAIESNQDFPDAFSASLGGEVGSNYANSGVSKPDATSSNSNRSRLAGRVKKNSKSREKGEFSQSSKSSQGEFSTSTSNSDESNASRFSCSNRPHMSKDVRWEAIRHVKMRDGVISLRHFNLLKKLGCGDIGTVYLAELIGSNCLFAIKVMDNEFLARRKKMPRAQTEREILRLLDHPFLPTLYAQFTSDNLSCLVMEYCPGGDLHVLRQKQLGRSFPEPAARFYVAEVLLALEYLHMLGIIYRDLKPENILVRDDGHIMLTDFDLSLRCSVSPTLLKSSATDVEPAKVSGPCAESSCIDPFCIKPACQVPCFSPRFLPVAAKARKLKAELVTQMRSLPQLVAEPTDARSNSFVGTHEYLAPEIIKGEGHGAAVDWWTFGIFLYELLYGKTPFKGSENEETLANVVMQNLKFPDSPLVSFQARDLIRGLLVKDPEYRLGSEKGAAEIKQHPFFQGLNWALIRCAIPPEVPDLCNSGIPNLGLHETNNKCLEYNETGEHLEFELF